MLATGCPGGDPDIEIVFRVVDTTGAAVDAIVSCDGACDSPAAGCSVEGTVTRLGDGEQICTIHPEAAPTVTLRADAGNASADVRLDVQPALEDVFTLTMWRPAVAVEEIDGQLVVTWDPAPATAGSAPGGWISVHANPRIGSLDAELGDTAASLPLEDFEDFADAQLRLAVTQTIDGRNYYQAVDEIAAPHTPVVPASRGAACVVSVATQRSEAYPAGECPMTDGAPDIWTCCGDAMTATIDLGVEQPIRRVLVRGYDGTIAASIDGVTFVEIDAVDDRGDALSPPVTARYVRVDGVEDLGEVSVFTR